MTNHKNAIIDSPVHNLIKIDAHDLFPTALLQNQKPLPGNGQNDFFVQIFKIWIIRISEFNLKVVKELFFGISQ